MISLMVLAMTPIREKIPGIFNNHFLLLAGIMVLGLIIRLIPVTYNIINGQVILPEFDTYYHLRRITYTIEHFPFTNIYDSYVNYPGGYLIGWPPLFDLIAATLSLIVGLGSPDRFTIELTSSMLPVAIGLLSLIPLYYLTKDAMGEKAALIAALVMAILPAAVFRTVFGFADHHALEVLVSLTMYVLFIRGVTMARDSGLGFSNLKENRKPVTYAVLAGIAAACMVFTWDGAPIFISIIVIYAFIQYAYDAYNKMNPEYLTVSGLITSVTALMIVAPFAATSNMGQQFQITAIYLSWFHILFLLGIAIFFLAAGMLFKTMADKKAPWYSAPAIVITAGAAALMFIKLALPQFFSNIEEGLIFLSGGSKVLQTIVEVEPLLSYNGELSFIIPWVYFSTAFILAILGFIAYLAFTLPDKKVRNVEIFLIVWTLIIIVLGLLQKRFVYLLAVNVAIFSGYMIYVGLNLAGLDNIGKAEKSRGKKKMPKAGEGAIQPALIAVFIISIIVLLPVLNNAITIASTQEQYSKDWNDACTWLRDNTPKTSYTYSADIGTAPEYGVMSWWDYGNFILYRGERPAVSNNFQTGIEDSARYFVAGDESYANSIMDKRNCRYVMIDQRMGSPYAGAMYGIFDNIPYMADEDPSSYYMFYRMPEPLGSEEVIDGNDKYYDSMYARMFYGDGCGGFNELGGIVDGLEHYRLVYVTSGIDPVKIFEYVKGSKITGTAQPGSKVELRLTLEIPGGDTNKKTYYSSAIADSDGQYSFTVPYPTSGYPGVIKAVSKYSIISGASEVLVDVPEDAISEGKVINAGVLS
ncbi:oligosaccharyl transferase, archaeosortase A system-associated [Methanocella sp. CWC-04]|uniref:dolichyl-phosphooligosaccharide-protein glycotransferase n=1 Tax=Methanooceanicella nereidis TaxID=2052831 RepID=A0AAP2RC14_9EURY|nr:oligosaccharyl transferase, archaeosortase A system-associated [Methanocella sp. CWC-04]MCD1294171.1 oligosaccharyl transferase, archaeosortase A system-associated [Methanocella sp. CWC-04]